MSTLVVADPRGVYLAGLEWVLRGAGHSVVAVCHRTIEVLPLVESHRPDLVIIGLDVADRQAAGLSSRLRATSSPLGIIYILQRGDKADPVIAINRDGQILRSWGKGMFTNAHSIRIDPKGNIWTVDAASSIVYQFTPEGKQLLRIDVGGLPAKPASAFCGTTDIAFAKGRIFISDGYANNRVVEYGPTGQKVREWGSSGQKPGQFHLPHAIAVDSEGLLYVADRENGRIQRFTLEGKYLGEWTHLGKTFSLKIGKDNDLWLGTQPHNVANGVECWLARVNRSTGKILGAIESGGHHSIELNGNGEPMTGARPNKILWFRLSGDR